MRNSKKSKFRIILLLLLLLPLSLLTFLINIGTVMATVSFEDGFESGDYSNWTVTNNATINQTNSKHGNYHSQQVPDGTGKTYIYTDVTPLTNMSLSFYFRLETDIGSFQQVGLCEIRNGTTTIITVAFRDRGANYDFGGSYFYPSSTPFDSTDFAASLNTWYFVQVYFIQNAGAGAYYVDIDGVNMWNVTGIDTSGASDPDRGVLGAWYYFVPTGNTTAYDTVRISDTLVSEYTPDAPTLMDDFNDNSFNATTWSYDYQSGPAPPTYAEESYRLNFTIPSNNVGAIRQVGLAFSGFENTDFDVQVDAYIPPGEQGSIFLAFGASNIWSPLSFWMLLSSNYGGIVQIYEINVLGVQSGLYSGSWYGRLTQMRMVGNGTHLKFYVQDSLVHTKTGYDWSPFNGYFSLGAINLGNQEEVRMGSFDNFFVFVNGTRDAYVTTLEGTYGLTYTDNLMPNHNLNYSSDITNLYAPGLNVSHYAELQSGYIISNWTYTPVGSPSYSTNNPYFVNVTEDYSMDLQIALNSSYRVLNVEAYSIGVSPTLSYGDHAYEVGTSISITASLVTISPPGVLPTWVGWYANGTYFTSSMQWNFTLNGNSTIATNATVPSFPGTWQFRSLDTMVDITPAFPVDGSGYQLLLNRTLDNISPNEEITHIAIRTFWAWNNTPTPEVPYLYDDGTQHPNFTQLAVAIDEIQERGYEVMLVIAHLWNDATPSGWDWEDDATSVSFLTSYFDDVISPVATFAETNGVDILGIAAEITIPDTPDDIPDFFTSTAINDKWIDVIASTRGLFNEKVTTHEASHWGTVGFNALEDAYFFSDFDFVILATWRDGLALSEPYTSYDIATGFFDAPTGGSIGRNTMQDMHDLYVSWGVRISLNLGWHNAYGVNLQSPASGAGSGDFRYDVSQTRAWEGTMWATQPQAWIAGIDFERYNEYYALGFGATYRSASIALVNATEEVIASNIRKVMVMQPIVGVSDATILDMDAGNYLFAETKYYSFQVIYTHGENVSNLDDLKMRFTAGGFNITVSYNYPNSTSQVEGNGTDYINLAILSTSTSSDDTDFTVIFGIYLLDTIPDSYDNDIFVYASDINDNIYGWYEMRTNYFNIYNLGGTTTLTSSGDAGKLVGGGIFDLYAHNGSWVESTIMFKNLQHVKLLPEMTVGLANGYIGLRYGLDYYVKGQGWVEGWEFRLNVTQFGIGSLRSLNSTIEWYNRGSLVRTDDVWWYHTGTTSNENTTSRFWIDLWFNQENSSSVVGGRVNAYYFPMTDSANPWLQWLTGSNWGIFEEQPKQVMFFETLLDQNDNTLYTTQIELVRLKCRLEVPVSYGAFPAQLLVVKDYDVFDLTLGSTPLEGVPTPIFDETKVAVMPQGGFLGGLVYWLSGIIKSISDFMGPVLLDAWNIFVGFMDSIATWLGYPGAFSQFIFWLQTAWTWLTDGFTYIISLLASIFTFLSATMGKFTNTLSLVVTQWVNVFHTFTAFLDGTYTSGINVWNDLGGTSWLTLAAILYPLYLVILWEEQGMDAVITQLKFGMDVVMMLVHGLIVVIQLAIRLFTSIIESIPVVE